MRITSIPRAVATLLAFATLGSAHPALALAEGLRWPVDGTVVTEFHTGSDPYAAGQHRGIDIAADLGTTVVSPTTGEVTYSGRLPDGGETVTLRANGLLFSHLHLATRAVKRGESVVAGSPLGAVGVTGKRSTEEPHLHFSVRDAGTKKYIDPMSLLPPRQPAMPAPVVPQIVAPQVEARVERRAAREAKNPRRQLREQPRVVLPAERPAAVAVKEVARPKRQPARAASADLEAPSPIPSKAIDESRAEPAPRSIEPSRPATQGQNQSRLRTALLAGAALLVAMLVARSRRRRQPEIPPAPVTKQDPAPNSNVIEFTRAS